MSKYADWAEAFLIFAKYADPESGWDEVACEHDEIFAGPDGDGMLEADVARLEELGWTLDEENGGFHRYV